MEALGSMFSSGAGATAAESAAGEGAFTGATAAADYGSLPVGFAGAPSVEEAGILQNMGATAVSPEAQAAFQAAANQPGIWDTITGAFKSAMPYVQTASQVMSLANMAKNALSGAPGQPQTPTSQSTAPLTPPVAPTSGGVSPTDYEAQQKAYWNQLFAGTGQGLPGGELPQDIQDMIARNAALLK